MQFIDHTGHIFSLPHYDSFPNGYEYQETPYIFWIKDDYSSDLSVNCIYIKSIYPIISETNIASIEISCDSTRFKLLSSKTIQEKIENSESVFNIDLEYYTDKALEVVPNKKSDFVDTLYTKDILLVENLYHTSWYWKDNEQNIYEYLGTEFKTDEFGNYYIIHNGEKFLLYKKETQYSMLPFYVVAANVDEAGTWMTNVLITIHTLDGDSFYCPITVGGTFVDEQEELTINGKNIGVTLPKDICRAFYNSGFYNEYADISLWNQKMKEYLLNHIKLRAERGNFDSALKALKWFGWGDKISLNSLVQTDNEFIDQYVLNRFDLTSDLIQEYRYFRTSTYVNLYFKGTVEDKENHNDYDFNDNFWGEAKPKVINLFDKFEEVHYDEGDITFYKPYYDFLFNEIALKLCALKYYYEKYFLPIHLSVYHSTITNQVFANDIKLTNSAKTLITEYSLYAEDPEFDVKFNDFNIIWLSEQQRYIDEHWNEHPNALKLASEYIDYTVYEISDNCFTVPIRFISKVKYKYYNCYLICYKDDTILKESHFQFYAPTEIYDLNFVIYPKLVNKNFDINFWLDSDYKIKLMVNGRWYEYDFILKVPELDIEMGKLVYKYDYDVVKQFIGFDGNKPKFNAFMYVPEVVMIENINFMNEYIEYMKNVHMYEISPDNRVFSDNIYYYYYDKSGTKIILSSGDYVLRLNPNTGKYELVRRDLLEILEGMTQDEIDEMFPAIYRYLSTETLINIDSELSEKLLLDSGKYDRSGIVDIPDDVTIYSSLYKNIYNMIDLYQENINIPKNNDFINRIYLFEVLNYNRGEFNPIPYVAEDYTSSEVQELNLNGLNMLRFGDNDSEQIKDLYSKFFSTENGDWNCDMMVRENGAWVNSKNEQIFYDFYLMHDNDYWYGVMISKNPISDIGYEINYNTYKITDDLYLRYVRYDDKMLINRMEYQSMNNIYHFKPDDFIVARLNNYKNIPFKLAVGSRWTFTPITLKPDVTAIVKANTNIGIVSIKEEKFEYPLGYYKAKVSYSIDNFLNENQERETKFLVTNEKHLVREISDEIYDDETPTIEEIEPSVEPTEPPTEEPWDPANKVTPKVNVILYSLNRQEPILDFNKDNIWVTSSGKKSVDLFLDFEADPRYEGDLALRVIIENYIDGYRPFKAITCIDGSGELNRTNEYVSPGQSQIGGLLLAPTMHDPSMSTDLHYDFIVEDYRTLKDYRFLFQILDNKYYYGLNTLFDIRIKRLSSEFLKKYPEVGVELVDENKNTIIDLTNFLNRGTYNYKCNLKDKVYKTGKPCYFHVYLVNKFEGENFQLQYSGDGLMNDFTSETYFPLYEYPEKYPDYIVNWSRDLKTVHSGYTIEQYTVYNFKFKIAENDYFYESSLEYNLNIYYPCYPDLEYNLKYIYEENEEKTSEITNYNTETNSLIIDSYISSDSKKYIDDWKLNVKLLNPINLQASLEYTIVAENNCYNSEKTLEELFNDPSVKRASIGNLASDIIFDLPDYPHDYLNNIYVMDNDNHAFILWSRPYIQIDAIHRYYFELRNEETDIQKFDLNIIRNPNKLYPEVCVDILDSKYSLVKSLSDKFVNNQCYYDVLNRDNDYFLYVYVNNVPEPQFEYTIGFGLNTEEINTEIPRKNYIKDLGNDSSAFILNLKSLYTVVEDETYLEKFKICEDKNFLESSEYTLNVNYPDNAKTPDIKISILNNSLEEIYDLSREIRSMGGFYNFALDSDNKNCKEFGPLYLYVSLRNIEYGETFTLQYSGKDGEINKEIELNNLSAQRIFPIYEWPEESLENDIEARYSSTNEYNLSTFKFKIKRNDIFKESELSYDITIQRPIYPIFKYEIYSFETQKLLLDLSRYVNHENDNETIDLNLDGIIDDNESIIMKASLLKPNIKDIVATFDNSAMTSFLGKNKYENKVKFSNGISVNQIMQACPIDWPYMYYNVVDDSYFESHLSFTINHASRYNLYDFKFRRKPILITPEIGISILNENFEKIRDVLTSYDEEDIDDVINGEINLSCEPGDIVLWDKEKNIKISTNPLYIDNFDVNRYTPIGVVVIPQEHDVYGTGEGSMMSLNYMSLTNPDNGDPKPTYMRCGPNEYVEDVKYFDDFPIINNDKKGTLKYFESPYRLDENGEFISKIMLSPNDYFSKSFIRCLHDNKCYYYLDSLYEGYLPAETKYIPSPYLTGNSRNSVFYSEDTNINKRNALSDFDGLNNTRILCNIKNCKQPNWKTDQVILNEWEWGNKFTGYSPAAWCCWRYSTEGTSQGDWYLPSAGEMGYLGARIKLIDNSISKIKEKWNIGGNFYFNRFNIWTSTLSDNDKLFVMVSRDEILKYLSFGILGAGWEYDVRSFSRIKIDNIQKINYRNNSSAIALYSETNKYNYYINLDEADASNNYLYIYVNNSKFYIDEDNASKNKCLPYTLRYNTDNEFKSNLFENYYPSLDNKNKSFILPIDKLNKLSKVLFDVSFNVQKDRNFNSTPLYNVQIKSGKIIQRLPEIGVKLLNENYEELNDFSENIIEGQVGFKCFIDDPKYLDKNLNLYIYTKNADNYENYTLRVKSVSDGNIIKSYINQMNNDYDSSLCIKMFRNTIDFDNSYPFRQNWNYSFDNLFLVYNYEIEFVTNENFTSDGITYNITIEVPAVIRAKMGFYIVNGRGEILDNLLDEGSVNFNISRLPDNREYVNIFNYYPCFFEDIYIYGFIENNPSNYPFVLDYYTLFSQTYTGGYAAGETANCNILDKVFGNEEKNGLVRFLLPIRNQPRPERLVDKNPGGYPGKDDSYQREMYGDIPDEVSYHDLGTCWCYSFQIVLKPNESFLSPAYFKYDFHFNIGKDPTVYPESFEYLKEQTKDNKLIFTLIDYDKNVLDTFSHSKSDITDTFKCGTFEEKEDELLYEYYDLDYNYPHDNVYLQVTVEKESMAVADGHNEPLPYSITYRQLLENGSVGKVVTVEATNKNPLILPFVDTYKGYPKDNMEHYMDGETLMSKFNFEFKLNENYYYKEIDPKSHVIMTRKVSEYFIIPGVAIVDEYFGVIESWPNIYEFTKSGSISLRGFNSKTSKRYLYVYATNPAEYDFYYYISFNNATYKSKSINDYTINSVGEFACNSESLAKNNPDYMKNGKYLSEFLIELYNFNTDPLDNNQYQLPITEIDKSLHIYTLKFGISTSDSDVEKDYTLQIAVTKEHTNHKDREGHDFVDDNHDELCDICGKPNYHDYYDYDDDGRCDECGEEEDHELHQEHEEEEESRIDLSLAIKITLDKLMLNNLDYLNDFIVNEDGINKINFIIDTSDPTYKNAQKLYLGIEFYGVKYGDYPLDIEYSIDGSQKLSGQFYNYGQVENSEDNMFVFELDLKSLTSQLPFEISEDGKYKIYNLKFKINRNEYYNESELYDIYIQYPIE